MALDNNTTPHLIEENGPIRKAVRAIGRISTWPLRKGRKGIKSMQRVERFDEFEKRRRPYQGELDLSHRQPGPQSANTPKRHGNPRLRSHSLKIGSNENSTTWPSSALLKLPLELRQQIWQESLGGLTLHFRAPKEIPTCFICRSPNPDTCENFGGSGGCENYPANFPLQANLLSLPLTCRQIYSESIEYLYSHNTFVTIDPDFILSLPTLLPPQHLSLIRSLRFIWILADPPVPHFAYSIYSGLQHKILSWETVWRNLANMEGLEELWVKLCTSDVYYMTHWDELTEVQVRGLVEPIGKVARPGKKGFGLVVTFRCELTESPWRELPCRMMWVSRSG